MAVRVRVRLEIGERQVVTAALANSGFESEEPEVIVPVRVAERLGIYPKLPAGSEVENYEGVGGSVVKAFIIKGLLRVSVLSGDRSVGPITATVVITPGEEEVILSDKAMDALRLVLLRPGEGVWRFADDAAGIERRSVAREAW